MTNEEKAIIKGKKWEAIIGLFLLIPPVLGIISFLLLILGNDSDFAEFGYFDNSFWESSGSIFMALMAVAGVLLLKGNLQYLFLKKDEPEKPQTTEKAN